MTHSTIHAIHSAFDHFPRPWCMFSHVFASTLTGLWLVIRAATPAPLTNVHAPLREGLP